MRHFIRRSVAFCGVLALAAVAAPAIAGTFNSGPYSASKSNAAGTQTTVMTSSTTTFCFLSSVGFQDIDSSTERTTCRVVRGAFAWQLDAVLSQNDDADVFCSAICYNN